MNLAIPPATGLTGVSAITALGTIQYRTSGDARRENDRRPPGEIHDGAGGGETCRHDSFGVGTIVDVIA